MQQAYNSGLNRRKTSERHHSNMNNSVPLTKGNSS